MRVSFVMGVSMVEAVDMVFGTAAFHECDDVGCDGQGGIAGCTDNRTWEWIENAAKRYYLLSRRRLSVALHFRRPLRLSQEGLLFLFWFSDYSQNKNHCI